MSRPLVFAVLLAFFADFSSCRRIKRTGVPPGADGLSSTHGFRGASGLAHLQFGSNVGVHGDPAAASALEEYDYMDVGQVPGTVSSGTEKGNVLELHTTFPTDGTTSASVSRRRNFDFGPTHSFFGSDFGTSQRGSLSTAQSQVLTRQQLPETSTHGRGGTDRFIPTTTVVGGVHGGDSVTTFDDRVPTALALKGSVTDGTKGTSVTLGSTGSVSGRDGEREPSSVQVPASTDISLRRGATEDITSTPLPGHTDDPKRVTTATADHQTLALTLSTDAEALRSTPGLRPSTTGLSDDTKHPEITTPVAADSNLQQGHSETLAPVAGPVSDFKPVSTVSAGTDSSVRNGSADHAVRGFTTSAKTDARSDLPASTSPTTTTAKELESPTLVSSTPSKGTQQPSTLTPGSTAPAKPAQDSSTVFEPLNKVAAETTSTVGHTFQQNLLPTRPSTAEPRPPTAEPRPPTAEPTVDAYVRPITEHSVDQFVPHRHRDDIEAYGHEDDHVRGSRCGRCQRKLHTCVEKCFLHHSCEAEANSELSCPRINAPCFPPFKYEVDQCKHSGDCEGTNHLCCLVGCSRKCVVGVRANHWAHP